MPVHVQWRGRSMAGAPGGARQQDWRQVRACLQAACHSGARELGQRRGGGGRGRGVAAPTQPASPLRRLRRRLKWTAWVSRQAAGLARLAAR